MAVCDDEGKTLELHEHLYDLGQRLGRTVFGNPADFRAALDDYLDEGAASSDDIALLVDVVRNGSLSTLTTALAGGADPAWAVDRTGDDLARERGDDDPARSRWAVAALGYATGSVPHELPARLWRPAPEGDQHSSNPGGSDRTQLSQSRAPWPTAFPPRPAGAGQSSDPGSGASPWPQAPQAGPPPQATPAAPRPQPAQSAPSASPSQPSPAAQPPAAQPPTVQPPAAGSASGSGVDFEAATRVGLPAERGSDPGSPASGPGASGPGASGPGASGPGASGPGNGWQGPPPSYPAAGGPPSGWSGDQGTPTKKSKLPVILAAVLAVVLIVAGGVYVAVAKPFGGGGDDKDAKKDDETSQGSSGDTGSPDVEVAVDSASLNERYSALGGDIASGTSDCKAGSPGAGQSEVVTCTVGDGITLTLATYEDVTSMETARDSVTTFFYGNLYSNQPGGVFYSESRESGNAVVYWDSNSGFRSAQLVSASSTLADVTEQFTATDPTVDIPTEIESERLRTMVGDWIPDVDASCDRQPTHENDMKEMAVCQLSGVGSFYVGEMVNRAKMRQLRNRYQGYAKDFDGKVGPWNFTGGASKGTLIEYVDPWEAGDPGTPNQDRAFLMWDNEFHKVFIQGWAEDANAAKFKKWWETA